MRLELTMVAGGPACSDKPAEGPSWRRSRRKTSGVNSLRNVVGEAEVEA